MKRLLWVVALLWPLAGHAMDGKQLLNACRLLLREQPVLSPDESVQAGLCGGYVGGIWELLDYLRVSKNPAGGLFCPPDRVQPIQAVRVAVRYLEKHPDLLRYRASQQVLRAFQKEFPCPPPANQNRPEKPAR